MELCRGRESCAWGDGEGGMGVILSRAMTGTLLVHYITIFLTATILVAASGGSCLLFDCCCLFVADKNQNLIQLQMQIPINYMLMCLLI